MKFQLLVSSSIFIFFGLAFLLFALISGLTNSFSENVIILGGIGFVFICMAMINLNVLKKDDSGNDEHVENGNVLLEKDEKIKQLQKELKYFEQKKLSSSETSRKDESAPWLKELPLGILRFNSLGKLIEELSTNCHLFFGTDYFQKNVKELLYIDEEAQDYFKSWLDILEANPMPMQHLAELLPSDVELPNPVIRKRGKTKPINLRYTFCPKEVVSSKGKVEEVIVFIQDVSKEKFASKTLATKESRLEFILNILRDRNRYITYLENSFDCISKIEAICEDLFDGNPNEKVNSAFRLVHTVRGNSAAFGVQSLRDTGDILEKILLEGRDGERELNKEYAQELKDKVPLLRAGLVDHLQETETTFNEVFDPNRAGNRTFRVPSSYITDFENALSYVEDEDYKIKLIRKLKEIYMVPVRKLLLQYSDTVKQLAERQDKLLSPLVINGGDTLISEKEVQSFFNSFIHLVLNCIDHGIEKPMERLEKGKVEEAIVRIRAQADDGGVYISIEDDGRGLNVEEIVKRALLKNMVNDVQLMSMTEDEKLNLIFKEGFSTTRKITSISGRGMGMSAVMHEVKALKGTISVSTIFGKGTIFTIFLPVEAF
ncbi:MAG: hypothetical protein COA79_01565 [Planctomycetota bacterium]|nr:MAG: hypothetical protein COA79_01565 [Planctomycetota bacterium]